MDMEIFKCKYCGKIFYTKGNFKLHKKVVHRNRMATAIASSRDSETDAELSSSSSSIGTTPQARMQTAPENRNEELPSHLSRIRYRSSSGYVSRDEDSASGNEQPLQREIGQQSQSASTARQTNGRKRPLLAANPYEKEEVLLSCIFCEKVCKDIRARDRHELTHTRPYQCPHCTEDFAEDYRMRQHLADVHYNNPQLYPLIKKGSTIPVPDSAGLVTIQNVFNPPQQKIPRTTVSNGYRQQATVPSSASASRESKRGPVVESVKLIAPRSRADVPATSEFVDAQIQSVPQNSSALLSPESLPSPSRSAGSSTSSTSGTDYAPTYTKEEIGIKTNEMVKPVKNHRGYGFQFQCIVCGLFFNRNSGVLAVEHYERKHSRSKRYNCRCGESFMIEKELNKHLAEDHNHDDSPPASPMAHPSDNQ